MDEHRQPPSKVAIHFAGGFFLGAFCGFLVWFSLLADGSIAGAAACMGVGGLLLGILAARYLDGFWSDLSDRWPWIWPF